MLNIDYPEYDDVEELTTHHILGNGGTPLRSLIIQFSELQDVHQHSTLTDYNSKIHYQIDNLL